MNGNNIGMVQLGQRPRLPRESFGESRIACEVLRKNLERDDSVQSRLPSFIDYAHAALAEKFEYLKIRETLCHLSS